MGIQKMELFGMDQSNKVHLPAKL